MPISDLMHNVNEVLDNHVYPDIQNFFVIDDCRSRQVLIIRTITEGAITDTNDPFQIAPSHTETLRYFPVNGRFYGDPTFKPEGGMQVDTGMGALVLGEEMNSGKTTFTRRTLAELLALFDQTAQRDFFFGDTWDKDTVAECEPIRVRNTIPDTEMLMVRVEFRKMNVAQT